MKLKEKSLRIGMALFVLFFVFATIGIVARLRLEGKWNTHLLEASPFDLMMRLIPYCICLIIFSLGVPFYTRYYFTWGLFLRYCSRI